MNEKELLKLLEGVRSGGTSPEAAARLLGQASYEDLGYAKVDHHRAARQGAAEVIFGQGKTADELAILASLFDLMRSNLALMALNTVSDERPQGPGGQGENAGDITRQAILDAAAAGTP